MCGFIVDIYGKENLEKFQKARDSLYHRGPDAYGLWSDKIVRMGHRRLSITGDNSSIQPMEKYNLVLCFNGELYEYKEHRKKLIQKGYIFDTDGDTEVFLALLKEGYPLKKIRGEFSFVLYDILNQKIFAGRDAFGVKPLVWSQRGTEFVFSSEAKAILNLGYERAWNKEALKQIVSVQYTWNETIFHNIKEVPAGHILELDIQSLKFKISKWFNYNGLEKYSVKEAIELAVRRRLETNKPYAMHLSGGIDSAIICALASRYKNIETYTIGFEGNWSEVDKAIKIAKHCGVKNNVIEVTHQEMLSVLPEALYHGEGIAINGHIGAKYLLNKRIHNDGYKINLSGEGSDELFLGYPFFREDFFKNTNNKEALEKLRKDNSYLGGHMISSNQNNISGWLSAKTEFGNEMRKVTGLPELNNYNFPGHDLNDLMEQSIESWRMTCLSGYILKTLADGQEMAHSIEGRPPFLDIDVAHAADMLSYEQRLKGQYDKQYLRDTFSDLLPHDIVYQKKHPFASPPIQESYNNIVNDFFNNVDFIKYFPGTFKPENIKNSTVKMAILSLGILGTQFKLGDIK